MLALIAGVLERVAILPRPLRFGGVGGGCAVLQLSLLAGLVQRGVDRHVANVVAFLVVTQIHFYLSDLVTWRDRGGAAQGRHRLSRRLILHNTMALLTLTVNQAVFIVASSAIHYLLASALGIVAASCANYRLSGRFTFAGATADDPGERC